MGTDSVERMRKGLRRNREHNVDEVRDWPRLLADHVQVVALETARSSPQRQT